MFKQVILTAPDIDRGVFEQIADALKKSASRITVYVSCKDKALNWSERIHSFPRLGLAPPGVLVVSGVDTIDASNVDTSFFGHSYAEDASTVLADLSELIRNGKPPDERFGLELTCDGYWEFRRRRY